MIKLKEDSFVTNLIGFKSYIVSKKILPEKLNIIKKPFFLTIKSNRELILKSKIKTIRVALVSKLIYFVRSFKQNQLIEVNEIQVGMSCQNLTDLLGGYRAITYLYLEKKGFTPSLEHSYLLLSTASENESKNFFLCERTRVDNIRIRQKIKKHIYDYDLIKIYQDPFVMVKYVFEVTSQYSRMQLIYRVNLIDLNLKNILPLKDITNTK